MKTKRSRSRHWPPESSNESESEKQKRQKRKITNDDIADYLINKYRKKASKLAKKIKSRNVSRYVNESNPFNDSKLDEEFVWGKKIERDVVSQVFSSTSPMNTNTNANTSSHLPLEIMYSVKEERRKQRERMEEIERVKRRREEKTIEKAEREERIAFLAKERARAEFEEWEKKEKEFCFEQVKAKAEIRLREGRIKPIDVLSMHLEEPSLVFEALALRDMEDLHKDITMHLDLDRATPTRTRYWEALLVVCDWDLAEARKKEDLNRARVRGEQPSAELLGEERGLHLSTKADVENLLRGKGHSELEVIQSEIESQMRSGTVKVVEYWEAVLRRIYIFKARAFLKEYHAKLLLMHLKKDNRNLTLQEVEAGHDRKNDQTETEEAEGTGLSYSPELLHDEETEEVAVDPEEDNAILERKRVAAFEEQRRIQEALASKRMKSTEDNFEIKAMGTMKDGDASSQVYWWHDKYRPRKPKYFNRVHTEHRWNSYNRTHYDRDNPPPNIVKGYKFSIFYPDLIGTKTPTYTIEEDGHSAETCIIRFHAGPPYEDIAFRIVNRDWDYSAKKGFKCTFESGTLHLNINFKHHSYCR